MQLKASTGRKLRYGSTSIALTALIIAAIIMFNVIATVLVSKFSVYVDLTPEPHFTLSDQFLALLGLKDDGTDNDTEDSLKTPVEMVDKFRADNKKYNQEHGLTPESPDYRDENVKINILFGLDEDYLMSNVDVTDDSIVNGDLVITEYVVRMAKKLEALDGDHFSVECVDAVREPTRFKKYLSANTDSISQDSVIIECGSEFRIRAIESFFAFSKGSPIAYNGEKAYASSILAVTRAETPLVCYTVNHGESFPDAVYNPDGTVLSAPFLKIVNEAGYKVQAIDLEKEEIPAECRILVIFDPKQDFVAKPFGSTARSEYDKLDDFLFARNSLMVFMNPSDFDGSEGLPELEDFLEEWGFAFHRDDDGSVHQVKDSSNSILGNTSAVIADYYTAGPIEGWSEGQKNPNGTYPKVVFPNCAEIITSTRYVTQVVNEEDDDGNVIGKFEIASNSATFRTSYDLFTSKDTATTWIGNREMSQAKAPDGSVDLYSLMKVTVDTRSSSEATGALSDSAFVTLCGSVDFASNEYLASKAYGNANFLLNALQMMGREPVAVGLNYVDFANYEIQSVTAEEATQYAIVLTLVPLLLAFGIGVFVLVRRKNR